MTLRALMNCSPDPAQWLKTMTSFGGPLLLFHTLSKPEQDDVLDGRCIYSEYEGRVILNYTKRWGAG